MAIELDWESKRVLVMRYKGMVQGREFLDATLKVSGDPRFEDLHSILSDWSEIKKTDLSVDDIKELAVYIGLLAQTNGTIKNATVTSKDEAGQSLASFYKHLTRELSWEVDSFNDVESARFWFSE